jgi:spoIIIJ-associated protein
MKEQTKRIQTFTGEDVEAAVENGLDEMGLARDQVSVEILDEGSRGILGIGGRPARVRLTQLLPSTVTPAREQRRTPEPEPAHITTPDSVSPGTPEPAAKPKIEEQEEGEEEQEMVPIARQAIENLLQRMGFDATGIRTSYPEPAADEQNAPVIFDIYGPGVEVLVGRQGETLAGFQRIVRLIVGKQLERRANLVIDIEGYKQQREQKLRGLARRMAEEAMRSGRTVYLEPMPAYERRIVHITLRDHQHVWTESVGEGKRRRVTIIPR